MKSSSKQVVCTLVFFSSCFFAVSGQTEMKGRAEKPGVDDKVEVGRAPGKRAPGIAGCIPAPMSTINVRIQSLKTSGGSVYTRQLVTTANLPCFENSTTKATFNATSIGDCAEATAKQGLNSFSWENGSCTAYLAWRPQNRADCKDGGSKVVYVVQKLLTPFEGGDLTVSGKLNVSTLPDVFIEIKYQYGICGSSSKMNKGYKIQINGSEVVMLPEGTEKYSLSRPVLCSGASNISIWSVGADGDVNSDEFQMSYAGNKSYYKLQSGACLYTTSREDSYDGATQYCNEINGTLYSANAEGEAQAFLDNMALLDFSMPFYVGLKWVAVGQWQWLGGLPVSSTDTIWDRPQTPVTYECAIVYQDALGWLLTFLENCSVVVPVVCYFLIP